MLLWRHIYAERVAIAVRSGRLSEGEDLPFRRIGIEGVYADRGGTVGCSAKRVVRRSMIRVHNECRRIEGVAVQIVALLNLC